MTAPIFSLGTVFMDVSEITEADINTNLLNFTLKDQGSSEVRVSGDTVKLTPPKGGYSSLESVVAVDGLPSIDWDVVTGWGD